MTQSFSQQVRTPGALPPDELARIQQLYADVLMQSDLSHGGRAMGRLPRTYAQVLLDAALNQGNVAAVTSNFLSLVNDLFPQVAGLEEFLDAPTASKAAKDAVILKVFDGRCEPLFVNFLRLLNEKDRLGLTRFIWVAYRSLLEERFDRQRVLVEAAAPLSDEEREKLTATLTTLLNKTPVLVVREQPELIGGLVVHVGDKVFDTSVRTKLTNFRNQLLARGSNEIQRLRDRVGSV
ncbi:MAG: ATP synthase F1 subunit delta [Fimbriiglobus sp.]